MKEYFHKGGALYEGPYEINHGDILKLHSQDGSVIRVEALDDAVSDRGCSGCCFYIKENCPYIENPPSNGIRQPVKLMCTGLVFRALDSLMEEI